MAYDPEARETSNTAMVIGIVALVVVVLGALAYWATRPSDTPAIVTAPGTTTIVHDNTPVPGAPPVVIQQPVNPPATGAPANPPASTTTRTDVHVTVPATSGTTKTAPATSRPAPNVTINNNNRPSAGSSTSTPPATGSTSTPPGDGATSTTTNSATTSSGAAPAGSPKY